MISDLEQGDGSRKARNVLGEPLQPCSFAPATGFFRDGHCHTCAQDHGSHTVCAVMTAEFLDFSKSQGNDLTTPMPQYDFAGLKPGDHWCLCAGRWMEACEAGKAPKVNLAATNQAALAIVPLAMLQEHAL
ncbi:MAG: DUF2237 domain-containing protein [Chthoniobacterales bacterium]|jgi:uncharacterized protein (DUF2237 family)|nr:DUF2237 domain-containing protein [Chthoniobacterales bacterium]